MTDLVLPLKREYFEEIKAGLKPEEFRLCTPYWAKRLEGRSYDRVILTLGYPAKDNSERRLVCAWRGFVKRQITHPHFGAELVDVYAIDVRGAVMIATTDSSEPDLKAIVDPRYKFTYGDLKKQAESEAHAAWEDGQYSLSDNPFTEGSWSHKWWHDEFVRCDA